jgi:hypothetical protein
MAVTVTTVWSVLELQIWIAANMSNKQSVTADKGQSSSLGLGKRLTNPFHKKQLVMKCKTVPWIVGSCEHGNEPSCSIRSRGFLD